MLWQIMLCQAECHGGSWVVYESTVMGDLCDMGLGSVMSSKLVVNVRRKSICSFDPPAGVAQRLEASRPSLASLRPEEDEDFASAVILQIMLQYRWKSSNGITGSLEVIVSQSTSSTACASMMCST